MPKTVNYQIDEGGNVGAPPTTSSNFSEAFNFITEFNENAKLFGTVYALLEAALVVANESYNTASLAYLQGFTNKGELSTLREKINSLREDVNRLQRAANNADREGYNAGGGGSGNVM